MNLLRTPHAVLPVSLCLLCAGPGSAQETAASATRSVAALYAQRDAASGRKDINGATACFAPNFHFIDEKGQAEGAPHYRKRVGDALRDVKTAQVQTVIQSVAITPAGAVATIRQRSQIAATYRVLFVKRTAHVTVDDIKRDTWVKVGPTWQLQESRLLSHKQDVHP